jgi:hypothetical protein
MTLAVETQGLLRPKLPFKNTVSLSYSSYFDNLTDLLRISWLWLVLITPLTGIATWVQMSRLAEAATNGKPGTPPQMPQATELFVFAGIDNAIALFAIASIAVAWHRHIILQEHRGLSGSNVATASLWRDVWAGLLFCLIWAIPILFLAMLSWLSALSAGSFSAAPSKAFLASIAVGILLYPITCVITLRLSLLLPATGRDARPRRVRGDEDSDV